MRDADDTEEIAPPGAEGGPLPPLPSPLRVEVAARSHPGLVRESNEDRYLVARLARTMEVVDTNVDAGEVPQRHEEAGYAMVVADGMGGQAAGEIASTMAIRLGTQLVLEDARWSMRIDDRSARELVDRVSAYLRQIDHTIASRGRSEPQLAGMGTTLTVAYAVGGHLFVFHVGDSRAYLHRGGSLQRLTRDQTMAQALADSGNIAPEEVSSHRLRHVLTSALGGPGGHARTQVQQLALMPGDQLLLCSDGLTEMMTEEAIGEVLSEGLAPGALCERLIELAVEAGGLDNVTVVAARFAPPVG